MRKLAAASRTNYPQPMASNIFNPEDYQRILQRIDGLRPDHTRRWGKMDLDQMLEHCCLQLRLGLGQLERTGFEGPAIQRTWLGRKLILYVFPWTKGLPTPSQMNMVRGNVPAAQFHAAQKDLLQLLSQVQDHPTLRPHPFLGTLSQADWGRLIWKHLDYHLRQFGN